MNLTSRVLTTFFLLCILAVLSASARQSAAVRLVSPNGAEQWVAGAQWSISWTATGNFTRLELHFSSDNGATWALIASPSVSSSTYPWQIPPSISSSQCHVRLTGFAADGQYSDRSDAAFSIAPETSQSMILFSGRPWTVETGLAGPGSNLWWSSTKSVWVDQDGNLHLRIRKIGNQWYCAEISAQTSLGYGEYRFVILSDVENLNPNIVVGLFLYASDTREYDIEFSRWKNRADTTVGSFTVQGTTQFPRTQSDFRMKAGADTSTHKIVWTREYVFFQSYRGHSAILPSQGSLIHQWTYTGRNNFVPGNERAYLNIWLYGATPPTDQAEAELVVKSFVFLPNVTAVGETEKVGESRVFDSYPNPFNGTTRFGFQLMNSGFVSLKAFDALGRIVATLVDGEQKPGRYEVNFDAGNLTSGVYFFRLHAGAFVGTKKVLLVK